MGGPSLSAAHSSTWRLSSCRRFAPADERAAWSLFEQRPDKAYSFTDCTSFVLMRREGSATPVALGEHFSQEGFVVVPARSRGR
jgi:hypothetical protein